MLRQFIKDLITLWVVIDPIGTTTLFLAMTRKLAPEIRNKIALRGILIAALILIAFIIIGLVLLEAMGIHLPSFQIAGGIILFLFGLQMIFEEESKDETGHIERGFDLAVFPLALPIIASPAAIMAVVVLTDYHRFSRLHQVGITLGLLGVLAVTYLFLLSAQRIERLIGGTGINILSRVMGLMLTALAVEKVIEAIKASFAFPGK
jgi:multiple antibiotic resistance protein